MTYAEDIGQAAFMARVTRFFGQDYHDRGMRKWQGYYLSDHTAAIKRARLANLPVTPWPRQPQAVIRQTLAVAFARNAVVTLQRNTVNAELALPPIIRGPILGLRQPDTVIVADQAVPISDIRHVHLTSEPTKKE